MTNKVDRVRQILEQRDLDGLVIPHSGSHLLEYNTVGEQRLEWMTSFTGSAGCAVILKNQAAIFVDGRYTLQAQSQVNKDIFEIHNLDYSQVMQWVKDHKSNARLGIDFRHISAHLLDFLGKGLDLVDSQDNIIDTLWQNKPNLVQNPAFNYDLKYAGVSRDIKIKNLSEQIQGQGLDYFITSQPDNICWLLNIRGVDVEQTPLVISHLIVSKQGNVSLFIHKEKAKNIDMRGVEIVSYDDFYHTLSTISGRVGLDYKSSCAKSRASLSNPVNIACPITAAKAIKNDTEIAGMRQAHIYDGVAIVKFLYWLDNAPISEIDEVQAQEVLQSKRKTGPSYLYDSFNTISGFGSNGAIVHYRADHKSNKKFKKDNLYLVDSGGQYYEGTTDITRTIAVGEPSMEQKRDFTLVLKAHIALASAKFPQGTTGAQLDAIARHILWRELKDYKHGTGHGVGCFLGVHEGPQNISPRGRVALKEGMICSNEPGLYKDGEYGIRIENLVVVTSLSEQWLGLETITMAPIDRRCIVPAMLESHEREWLNNYHGQVFSKLQPLIKDEEIIKWLEEFCLPIN